MKPMCSLLSIEIKFRAYFSLKPHSGDHLIKLGKISAGLSNYQLK